MFGYRYWKSQVILNTLYWLCEGRAYKNIIYILLVVDLLLESNRDIIAQHVVYFIHSIKLHRLNSLDPLPLPQPTHFLLVSFIKVGPFKETV